MHKSSSYAICATSTIVRVRSSLCLHSVTVSSKRGIQLHAVQCWARSLSFPFLTVPLVTFRSVRRNMHHRRGEQLPTSISHTWSYDSRCMRQMFLRRLVDLARLINLNRAENTTRMPARSVRRLESVQPQVRSAVSAPYLIECLQC